MRGRISSALPTSTRIFFAILFFIAWRIEDSFLARVVIWSSAHPLNLASHAAPLSHALEAPIAFVHDGFSYIGAAIAGVFQQLPVSIREALPTASLGRLIAALGTLFGLAPALGFGSALMRLAGALVRVLVALNIAGWLYNVCRRARRYLAMALLVPVGFYAEKENGASESGPEPNPNQPISLERHAARRREYVELLSGHIQRIGIILPACGARGAYQAGALQAVHDFLQDYGALAKVKMITASSIGAWNAMFWLTGMMEREAPGASLVNWWKQTEVTSLLEFPWLWAPFFSESRFGAAPWREQFMMLFRRRMDALFEGAPAMHFYFTRTDVALGALGYATNWSGVRQVTEKLGLDKQDNYRYVDVIEADGEQVKRTADAVFASLGGAPFFQGRWGEVLFEDGGAVDPIPLRFAAPLEDCDLVFVLPATGPLELAGRSRMRRMERLAHLQQAALERAALRHADTINRVGERFERMHFGAETIVSAGGAVGIAADAVGGVHEEIDEFNHIYKRLYLFTACPGANLELSNRGFRDQREISAAFDLMYEQTKLELQHRLFEDIELEDAQLVMVDGALDKDGKPVKPAYRRLTSL